MFWKKWKFEKTPEILVKFCTPSELRLWRTGMLLLTKSKGHKSNSPYSGLPNHLQTKSNLHISIRQSQIHCIKCKWETLYVNRETKKSGLWTNDAMRWNNSDRQWAEHRITYGLEEMQSLCKITIFRSFCFISFLHIWIKRYLVTFKCN